MKGCVYIATSLDGFIAEKDGNIDWLNNLPPPTEEEGDMGFAAHLASVDCMIMGRNTFDKVISFGKEMWAYGKLPIIVWSRSPVEIPDYRQDTVTCSSLPPKELFEKLEKDGYKRAYIDGGVTVQKFLEAGLVHHICQSMAPILLGGGIPLYGQGLGQKKLKLEITKSYSNGMVSLDYEVIN